MSTKLGRYIAFTLVLMTSGTLLSFGQQHNWADSVYRSMTLEEKIGQLFIIRAHTDKEQAYEDRVARMIKKYKVGGVCFFQGGPVRQARLTNRYQSLANIPLFISQDAEWGLGMRLDSTISFPRQMTLGAMDDKGLVYETGAEIARHCKRIGVNMNFAPVVDINSNAQNPVINTRSFGEDRIEVADNASMMMYGMQDNGVIATAKHFPGHGDTDTDSHETLPSITHSRNHLDSVELYPFRQLIKDGVSAVMTAHLHVPALDSSQKGPVTLSEQVITGLLEREMGFDGLIVTDALEMEGIARGRKSGQIAVEALNAGNDLLLLPNDLGRAVKAVKKAVKDSILPKVLIDEKVRKILSYKQRYSIHTAGKVTIPGIYESLNGKHAQRLIRRSAEKAVTIIQNHDSLLPLSRLDTMQIASVAIGATERQPFQNALGFYTDVASFQISKNPSPAAMKKLLRKLSNYNLVIASVHNTSSFPFRQFGVPGEEIAFLDSLAQQTNTILDVFGIPYIIKRLQAPQNFRSILISYQDRPVFQQVSAQIIFGGLPAGGQLPVSADSAYPAGKGMATEKTRLSFIETQTSGIKKKYIDKIDSIIRDGLEQKAYPGCQVLMAHKGHVFLDKAYGYHTYDQIRTVQPTDIYDIASITKIAATTLAVMKLSEDRMMNVDRRLSYYIPYLRYSNKKNILIRELMAHQARLQSWIPYYEKTIIDDSLDGGVYHHTMTENYSTRVAEDLYIHDDYSHAIFDTIATSELRETNGYEYSDLGFYLLYEAIENITNEPFEKYVERNFYTPLGTATLGYLPRKRFSLNRIVPTEKDEIFRHQLIHGDVHDPGAAMLGGISGHAGLFSNARDLAVIMQMLLNGGEYGGIRYFDSTTVRQFTKTQFPLNDNRKALGFDKPVLEENEPGPSAKAASSESFGHSGFTGTLTWADPENETIFVFLSNRVHPDADNYKLIKMDIRTKIHSVLYEAVNDLKK